MAGTDVATVDRSGVDREAILRHLNLNPSDVNVQALLLICERYGLDPLLKHVVLISGRPYVTRDGYLHVAHRSGQLDGIEVLDEGKDASHWWAKVAVHRKDMSHPFTYRGRYPLDGQQKKYGPEMAIKCAEVMSLRRAFDVQGIGAADEQWDAVEVEVDGSGTAVEVEWATPEQVHDIRKAAKVVGEDGDWPTVLGVEVLTTRSDGQKGIGITSEAAEALWERLVELAKNDATPAEPPSASEDAKDAHEQRPFDEPEAAA